MVGMRLDTGAGSGTEESSRLGEASRSGNTSRPRKSSST